MKLVLRFIRFSLVMRDLATKVPFEHMSREMAQRSRAITKRTSSHATVIADLFVLIPLDCHVVWLTRLTMLRLSPDVVAVLAAIVVNMRVVADGVEVSPVVGLTVRTKHSKEAYSASVNSIWK